MWKPPEPAEGGVLHARRVVSMAPRVAGESVWWDGGRIRGVGPAAAIERKAPRGLPRYDYPGALVTPGFVDGHTHFAMWALSRRRVQLGGARTRAEAVQRVAAGSPSQGWVLGHGWDANGWHEPPSRHALDRVHASPVYLDSLDVHAAWVNSAALAVARITSDTPDPDGGRIVRDAAGEPTGLLLERAVDAGVQRGAGPVDGDPRRRDARGAGRSAPPWRHRDPRCRGRARLGLVQAAGAVRRAAPAGAVPSAGGRPAGPHPPRRSGAAPDRRGSAWAG